MAIFSNYTYNYTVSWSRIISYKGIIQYTQTLWFFAYNHWDAIL